MNQVPTPIQPNMQARYPQQAAYAPAPANYPPQGYAQPQVMAPQAPRMPVPQAPVAQPMQPQMPQPMPQQMRPMPQVMPVANGVPTNLHEARNLALGLEAACRAKVQGREEVIRQVVCALLADGHVLLEDYPGSGKTTLAKALGDAIMRHGQDEKFSSFGRVQFTPDLLPSDVTGASIFDEEKKQFVFRPGPIFTNVLLADEINRTSPKVQAALLEAMAEKQVTADAGTQKLEEIFFVLATQNPLDLVGTYPLPQAQLDRFLFKIKMAHLKRECEIDVLARWKAARAQATPIQVTPAMLIAARNVIGQTVTVHPHFYAGLVDIANNLRRDSRVLLGISTRSLVLALPALQTWAAINGRDYVSAEDIKALAIPIFSHRLTLQPGQKDADTIVMECIAPVVEALTRATMR